MSNSTEVSKDFNDHEKLALFGRKEGSASLTQAESLLHIPSQKAEVPEAGIERVHKQ